MKRLSRIVRVDTKCNHMQREVEGDLTDERRDGNVTTEAEIAVIQPQTREASSHQKL